jgi:hypothetical protein
VKPAFGGFYVIAQFTIFSLISSILAAIHLWITQVSGKKDPPGAPNSVNISFRMTKKCPSHKKIRPNQTNSKQKLK